MKKILIIFMLFLLGSNAFAYTQEEARAKLTEMCREPQNKKGLVMAIYSGEKNIADLYMDAGLIDLNDGYMGGNFLINALFYQKPDIAISLMEHGAEFKTKYITRGFLYYAVGYKQDEPAVYMLKHGAYEILEEKYKREILFYAVKNNLTDTVETILSIDPDADIKRSRFLLRAPLITTAKRHENDVMVDMLSEHLQQFEQRKAAQKAAKKLKK